MKCCHCGKNCIFDYYAFDIKRVKNGYLHLPINTSLIYCENCYKKIVDELNRKAKEM